MQIKQLLNNQQLSRLDNRLLIAQVTNFSHAQIIANNDYSLTPEQLVQYTDLVNRVIAGEPLAYIIGTKEFYSREFTVTAATLIPRPETELLVELVVKLAQPNSKVLDLGTGSGCIAITCKLEREDLNITATDKYPETLAIAQQNAKRFNAEISFIESDWFTNITDKFDIIVSNPPYIEINDKHLDNLQFEPLHALTDFGDGLLAISQIIRESKAHLNNHGYLIFEHGYNQAEKIRQILYNYGLTDIKTLTDYANLDRITYGKFIHME